MIFILAAIVCVAFVILASMVQEAVEKIDKVIALLEDEFVGTRKPKRG